MNNCLITIMDMIKQRGYNIVKNDDEKITWINNNEENIVVFKTIINKFNVDNIKQTVFILNNIKINHCIVIYLDSITSMAKKLIESSVDIKFELFTCEELQYNITKHRLVPKHIKLNEEECKEFKSKHGVNFSILLTSDPVSRFFNFQRGDIIKIIRTDNDTSYITHRIVKG